MHASKSKQVIGVGVHVWTQGWMQRCLQGEEERKRIERQVLGSVAELGWFISPHCDSPFVNHTVYISKQTLKDTEKEIEREWGKKNREGEMEKREQEKSREEDSLNFRVECKSRASTFVLPAKKQSQKQHNFNKNDNSGFLVVNCVVVCVYCWMCLVFAINLVECAVLWLDGWLGHPDPSLSEYVVCWWNPSI